MVYGRRLPFRAEYCKTSRAKCKRCSKRMESNSLKLGLVKWVRYGYRRLYEVRFHHVECLFRVVRLKSVKEIENFESLRFEDKKLLETAIKVSGSSVGRLNELARWRKTTAEKKNTVKSLGPLIDYNDFLVGYAKTGNAQCQKCLEPITEGSVRIAKIDYVSENRYGIGPFPRWYHVECFNKSLEELKFYGRIDKIKQFEELDERDQKSLKETIKPLLLNLDLDDKIAQLVDKGLLVQDNSLTRALQTITLASELLL